LCEAPEGPLAAKGACHLFLAVSLIFTVRRHVAASEKSAFPLRAVQAMRAHVEASGDDISPFSRIIITLQGDNSAGRGWAWMKKGIEGYSNGHAGKVFTKQVADIVGEG